VDEEIAELESSLTTMNIDEDDSSSDDQEEYLVWYVRSIVIVSWSQVFDRGALILLQPDSAATSCRLDTCLLCTVAPHGGRASDRRGIDPDSRTNNELSWLQHASFSPGGGAARTVHGRTSSERAAGFESAASQTDAALAATLRTRLCICIASRWHRRVFSCFAFV